MTRHQGRRLPPGLARRPGQGLGHGLRRRPARLASERGSASIWGLLVTATAFTLLLGLVVDGGRVIDARVASSRAAGQAARVAADALSQASVRDGRDQVDVSQAVGRAESYLHAAAMSGTVHISATPSRSPCGGDRRLRSSAFLASTRYRSPRPRPPTRSPEGHSMTRQVARRGPHRCRAGSRHRRAHRDTGPRGRGSGPAGRPDW